MTDLNRTSRARLELRDAGNGMITLSGYASVFDKPYLVGEFEEVVRPGAFRRSLNSKPGPDVSLNVNHGAAGGLPLARTGAGSLRLREDDHGLAFRGGPRPRRF